MRVRCYFDLMLISRLTSIYFVILTVVLLCGIGTNVGVYLVAYFLADWRVDLV